MKAILSAIALAQATNAVCTESDYQKMGVKFLQELASLNNMTLMKDNCSSNDTLSTPNLVNSLTLMATAIEADD